MVACRYGISLDITLSLRLLVSYRVERSKRNSIPTCAHEFFSVYNMAGHFLSNSVF